MKKIICLILTLVMAFSMISVSAFAEGESENSVDEETLRKHFTIYLKAQNSESLENMYCNILGEYNEYVIFHGGDGSKITMSTPRIIDNYSVYSPEIEIYYDLGIYVFNGTEICTLEKAIMRKYFKMGDIAHLSDWFKKVYNLDRETLTNIFINYLDTIGYKYDKEYLPACLGIIGEYDKYTIFDATGGGDIATAGTAELIDNYVVVNVNIEHPYEIGVYVYDGTSVCTLKEAVEKKYFRMADIAHLSDYFFHAYDVNGDDKLDMEDAVTIQRVAAKLESWCDYYYHIINQNSEMEAVVKVQQYVAKLITVLS